MNVPNNATVSMPLHEYELIMGGRQWLDDFKQCYEDRINDGQIILLEYSLKDEKSGFNLYFRNSPESYRVQTFLNHEQMMNSWNDFLKNVDKTKEFENKNLTDKLETIKRKLFYCQISLCVSLIVIGILAYRM